MIGIIIVTHCNLGDAFIETAEFILGKKIENIASISIDIREDVEKQRKKITKKIKDFKLNSGILILTDMFGGTPSNLSYSFLEEGKIEVISGVNLPLLIKAISMQKKDDLLNTVRRLEEDGKKSISLASSILQGNKKN